jgi:NTE family protein
VHERPDILVLGGGGRQGDAWMTGLLAGLEDAAGIDFRACEYFVGTSAGAIVGAKLAVGRALRRPASGVVSAASGVIGAASGVVGAASGERPPLPNWAANSAMAIAAPFARIGLRVASKPAEMVRAAALGVLAAQDGEAPDFHAAFPPSVARFDGRLRVVAVERRSGKRVVFGAPGAPAAEVAEALTASCALPLVFPPATVGGREYVDGAVWSPTNADVAPATRDARVLILSTMASLHGPFIAPVRAASLASVLVEASALKARGSRVEIITPDRSSALSIGRDLMSGDGLDQTLAAGYAQGLSL